MPFQQFLYKLCPYSNCTRQTRSSNKVLVNVQYSQHGYHSVDGLGKQVFQDLMSSYD